MPRFEKDPKGPLTYGFSLVGDTGLNQYPGDVTRVPSVAVFVEMVLWSASAGSRPSTCAAGLAGQIALMTGPAAC